MVSPDKNIFKCFGCGKEGGPVEFLMDIEGIKLEEAVN
jgi:DNA primase